MEVYALVRVILMITSWVGPILRAKWVLFWAVIKLALRSPAATPVRYPSLFIPRPDNSGDLGVRLLNAHSYRFAVCANENSERALANLLRLGLVVELAPNPLSPTA
ncbi:hypothetical protein BGZ70_006605, partial [Mortierella alpina]